MGFLLFLGFLGVFPPSPLSPILVSSLYTSCMLWGAFYAFYKILYLSKKKKKLINEENRTYTTVLSSWLS
jgi:hypothetical protein